MSPAQVEEVHTAADSLGASGGLTAGLGGGMVEDERASMAPQRFEGKVGLYWRTSNRLAAPHHPTVMALAGGRLSAVTSDGAVLFEAPVGDFAARFSRWGTLLLTHSGELFRFVAGSYAGTSAVPFSAAQENELREAGSREPDSGTGFMAGALTSAGGLVVTNLAVSGAGLILGFASRLAGVATMFRAQFGSFRYIRMWTELLHAAGVPTVFTTRSYAASVLSVTAIVIPCVALLALGVYALLSALS